MVANLFGYPKSYLEAWRDATLGYWFVGVKDSICTGAGYEWLPSFDQYSEHIEFPQDRHQNGSTIFEAVISIEEYNLTIEHLRSIPILILSSIWQYRLGYLSFWQCFFSFRDGGKASS